MFLISDTLSDCQATPDIYYSAHESLSEELQVYLNSVVTREFDLVSWWENNQSRFPRLHKLFVKVAVIPATTSVVESEFSYTGMVITDRRSGLLPDNVNDLMVARNNVLS